MNNKNFEVIILLGRSAAGKSEVIDYLKKTPLEERQHRFHLGKFEEIDDFPMLWIWFEKDAILEKILKKTAPPYDKRRLFFIPISVAFADRTDRTGIFQEAPGSSEYHDDHTSIIEFFPGSEHGGYRAAFAHLTDEILEKAGIVFINVSYQESLRKNRRRFNPNKPDSILEHGLPDAKLERLYKAIDWEEVSRKDPEVHFYQKIIRSPMSSSRTNRRSLISRWN